MSKQLYETLLADLTKSNNVRKLQLATKAGFKTVELYRTFLQNQIGKPSLPKSSAKKTPTIAPKAKKVPRVDFEPPVTDMVIAFDTTGSMSSYINAVKKHVKDLIPKLFAQNSSLNLSIVAFGDYCDMKSATEFGRAYQCIGLTNDQNKLIKFVTEAKNTGGGDGDEFYELVIKKITEETQWRDNSSRTLLLIGDCEPHKVGYSCEPFVKNARIDWKQEAMNACTKGIKIDTLRIHAGTRFYEEVSRMTDGVCLNFSSSNKTADLVEATSLARGGERTRSAFMAKSRSKSVLADKEISAVYSMYSKTIIED